MNHRSKPHQNGLLPYQDIDFSYMCNPIDGIFGVWKFERQANFVSQNHSLPDHLLHLVLRGSYELTANERTYAVHAGDVIYYYGSEEVRWVGGDQPVTFYSVGFQSRRWLPLPIEKRVLKSTPTIRRNFDRLYAASKKTNPMQKVLQVHAALLAILNDIEALNLHRPSLSQNGDNSWWRIEFELHRRRLFRPTLDEMAHLIDVSRSSVVRLCRKATGTSPFKRIQQLRMQEAMAMLQLSTLTVTQVADMLGYSRVHEFSREFSQVFNIPPSHIIHR